MKQAIALIVIALVVFGLIFYTQYRRKCPKPLTGNRWEGLSVIQGNKGRNTRALFVPPTSKCGGCRGC